MIAVSRLLHLEVQKLTCCDLSLREVSYTDARLFALSRFLGSNANVGLGLESKTATLQKDSGTSRRTKLHGGDDFPEHDDDAP